MPGSVLASVFGAVIAQFPPAEPSIHDREWYRVVPLDTSEIVGLPDATVERYVLALRTLPRRTELELSVISRTGIMRLVTKFTDDPVQGCLQDRCFVSLSFETGMVVSWLTQQVAYGLRQH